MRPGIEIQLIRVGIVIGLWVGTGITSLASPWAAIAFAVGATVVTGALLAVDVRKAWREHRS